MLWKYIKHHLYVDTYNVFYYIYTKLYICLAVVMQPTYLFCFLSKCLYQIQFQRKIFHCSCQFIIYKRILILLNFFICHVCFCFSDHDKVNKQNSCEGKFLCDDNVCLDMSHHCDNIQDCADGSDEKSCHGMFLLHLYSIFTHQIFSAVCHIW